MKRFLVFAYNNGDTLGGAQTLKGHADTMEDADEVCTALLLDEYNRQEILDTETLEVFAKRWDGETTRIGFVKLKD